MLRRDLRGFLSALLLSVCLGTWALAADAAPSNPAIPGTGFSPQTRVGYTQGDQWEPAIAADGYNHVYILYPQYKGVPGCPSCPLPSMTLVVSDDNGATWHAPRAITPPAAGQFDPQIAVDPADRRTLYAAWLQRDRTETVVAKSADFGQSWSVVIADRAATDSDKPVLAVRGQDVYVGFSRGRKLRVAASHDGGITFTTSVVLPNADFLEAMAGGATVDSSGDVYFAWSGYTRNVRGRANLYVSTSLDDGATWATSLIDTSAAPPDCSSFRCGWSYLSAQITIASDSAGALYTLWNSSAVDGAPSRTYLATSNSGGATWSAPTEVSGADANSEQAFPAIAAAASGDVRIAWMERGPDSSGNRSRWNTIYRASTNGGVTWTARRKVSGFISGYTYIRPDGFSFPFGDYFEMDIDAHGQTQIVWGEGQNFQSPGSIWHTRGR